MLSRKQCHKRKAHEAMWSTDNMTSCEVSHSWSAHEVLCCWERRMVWPLSLLCSALPAFRNTMTDTVALQTQWELAPSLLDESEFRDQRMCYGHAFDVCSHACEINRNTKMTSLGQERAEIIATTRWVPSDGLANHVFVLTQHSWSGSRLQA